MWAASKDVGIRKLETLVGGCTQPIWTNLECIHRAKKRNPRQVRWPLFFSPILLPCISRQQSWCLMQGISLEPGNSTAILDWTFRRIWVSSLKLSTYLLSNRAPRNWFLPVPSEPAVESPKDLWWSLGDSGLPHISMGFLIGLPSSNGKTVSPSLWQFLPLVPPKKRKENGPLYHFAVGSLRSGDHRASSKSVFWLFQLSILVHSMFWTPLPVFLFIVWTWYPFFWSALLLWSTFLLTPTHFLSRGHGRTVCSRHFFHHS